MRSVYPYKKESLQTNDILIKLRGASLTLVVVLINVCLRIFVYKFTKLMRLESYTDFYKAYINRYTFLYFSNTAFIPYIVHSKLDN